MRVKMEVWKFLNMIHMPAKKHLGDKTVSSPYVKQLFEQTEMR